MSVSAAGAMPAPSTTARPANKGANTEGPDPALMRRTVDAVVTVTGCRRKEARQRINAWRAGGEAMSDLDAYLRATFHADPTGVTVVREVMRGRTSLGRRGGDANG